MDSKILELLKKDYPMIGAETLVVLEAYFQGIYSVEQNEFSSFSAEEQNVLSVLNKDYSAFAQNASLMAENEAKMASVAQFKEALAQELTKRNVPEYFWRAALDLDDMNADVSSSADAIKTQYDAFCQEQNNASLSGDSRPKVGQKMEQASAAVENYIRSLRSDSPLAGKLKG